MFDATYVESRYRNKYKKVFIEIIKIYYINASVYHKSFTNLLKDHLYFIGTNLTKKV